MSQIAHLQTVSSAWRRSPDEEFVNATTHAIGLIFAIIGALVMMTCVLASRNAWLPVSCNVYVTSLVAVYAMSTLSHIATSAKWKSLFRRLDQAFIYLLIAATYTPYSLAYLRGDMWWLLLAIMWGVALMGAASKLLFAYRVEAVSAASYVLLAWMPIIALPTLWHTAPLGAFEAVVAGGACNMVGLLFFIHDERVRYFHAAWHLCVVAGSGCHFLGILVYVVRNGS